MPIKKSAKPVKKIALKVATKGLADFRAIHDKSFVVPHKIKEGLGKLGAAGWAYEAEFVTLCGLSQTDFARFRDDFSEFYIVLNSRTGKRVWAGSKATAEKMREMI